MCLAFIFEDMSFVGGNTIIFIHIYKKMEHLCIRIYSCEVGKIMINVFCFLSREIFLRRKKESVQIISRQVSRAFQIVFSEPSYAVRSQLDSFNLHTS